MAGIIAFSSTRTVGGQFVGLVCAAPPGASSCPPPPVTVSGSVGSQLMVPILIQGSDIFSGFDITLKTNHTILTPVGVSLTGSLLSGGTVVVECVGNALKAGPRCSSTDTPDTLHLVLVGPLIGLAPVTGLLFNAVFNITSSLSANIGYQTGCTQSSVNGTSTCVLFTSGSLSNPIVSVQPATYTVTPSPTFGIASSRTEIRLGKGETENATLTVTSFNGFSGSVAFQARFIPSVNHPPSFSVNPSSMTIASGSYNTATFLVLTRNNTDKTGYNVTITASSGAIVASISLPVTVVP